MTLNSETQRVVQRGINITAACYNLSSLVVDGLSDLFGYYHEIDCNLKYAEKLWCHREKCFSFKIN